MHNINFNHARSRALCRTISMDCIRIIGAWVLLVLCLHLMYNNYAGGCRSPNRGRIHQASKPATSKPSHTGSHWTVDVFCPIFDMIEAMLLTDIIKGTLSFWQASIHGLQAARKSPFMQCNTLFSFLISFQQSAALDLLLFYNNMEWAPSRGVDY